MLPDSFNQNETLSRKDVVLVALLSIAYLVLSYFLIGYKQEQVLLVALFSGCYFLSAVTRKFILGFSVFIVFWIIFDYMKAFPNYLYNEVHIRSLYLKEKAFFGLTENGVLITPNEYWLQHHNTFLDVLSGFFYLSWIPVPLIFGAFLFFKDRRLFFRFSLTFLLVNLLGFCLYYIYPAAQPWYIQQYGFDFIPGTKGNTAGVVRFDAFFDVSIFRGLYEKSSNVFAAMPSLHSSYPLIVLYYGIKSRAGWLNLFFAAVMVGIWFAAVYTSHHYVLDVIAGIVCAITGILLFNQLLKKSTFLQNFMDRIVAAVS